MPLKAGCMPERSLLLSRRMQAQSSIAPPMAPIPPQAAWELNTAAPSLFLRPPRSGLRHWKTTQRCRLCRLYRCTAIPTDWAWDSVKAGLPPINFPDAGSVSGYVYEAMCWMTGNGLIGGMTNETLNPASTRLCRAIVGGCGDKRLLASLGHLCHNEKI